MCPKASFTSLLFHVWFHNAFATFPPTPFSIQMYKHLDHFSFILPHAKFSIQFKLVNSTGNYLWGFEIFNTTSGRPLHGISKVVMLSLTNSVIELNECVMNALVDFQNSILLVSEIHEEVTLITVVYNDKKQGK